MGNKQKTIFKKGNFGRMRMRVFLFGIILGCFLTWQYQNYQKTIEEFARTSQAAVIMVALVFLGVFGGVSYINFQLNIHSPSFLDNKRGIPCVKERHEHLMKYANLRL